MRPLGKSGREKKNRADNLLRGGTDVTLAAAAIVPSAFALLELSTPMLLSRAPTYPEIYAVGDGDGGRGDAPLAVATRRSAAGVGEGGRGGAGCTCPVRLRSVAVLCEEDGFEDEETGTRWDVLGRGLAGEFTGRALDPVRFSFDKVFWFAWKHYHQDTALFRIPGEQERPETPYVGQPPR